MKEKYIIKFVEETKEKSDRLMNYFLLCYFLVGLLLAFYYDTWQIAIGVGSLSLLAYYLTKKLLPDSNLYQYVLSIVIGIFIAQFIYQMHGLFEMHFFAFIGSVILITFRNWKLQIPLAILVLTHHAVFGFLQFKGMSEIYFTQLEYMPMQVFFLHAGLTIAIFSVSGLWAYNFNMSGLKEIEQSFEIGKLQEVNRQNGELIALSERLRQGNQKLIEANWELEKVFNTVAEVLFSVDIEKSKLIQISAACKQVFGYAPYKFLADSKLLKNIIHPEDKKSFDVNYDILKKGEPVQCQYRILHADNKVRWIEAKITPTLNEEGKLIRIDGIFNDITNESNFEIKLAKEKNKSHLEMIAAAIMAQENERTFLGEELHDNINPILATAKLYLDSAISDWPNSMTRLEESKGFITTAMTEIRTLSRSLIPPSLGDITLKEAINDMINNLRRITDIKFITNWEHLDEYLLNDKLKLNIFRIIQEQLNNILRHARANKVLVELNQKDLMLVLIIKDNGIGFDISQKRNGVGLQNIFSRTELLNGNIVINTTPGMGCELILKFKSQHESAGINIK